ncbi:MAG TPA: hypothetical protein VGN88_14015 [Phycisphaerae bacterium]
MKSMYIGLMMIGLAAGAAQGAGGAKGTKAAPVDKTQKALTKLETKVKAQPLAAQLLKVDGEKVTVKTLAMMGPDGLIPEKEKTYDTTNATVVEINGETKTLADLTVGATVQVMISDDGKTLEHVTEKVAATAGAKAPKKAAAPEATPPAGPLPGNPGGIP